MITSPDSHMPRKVPVDPNHIFARVPKIIRKRGRVKGFEAIRDLMLSQYETLALRMNPYNVIKLALESDRHALFAEVAEAKSAGTGVHREMWDQFQSFLSGAVEAPGASTESAPESEELDAEA
jgi:hypothetical protein